MVKAANASGGSSNILSLNLTVNPAAPMLVDAGEQTYFTGRAIETLRFINNGGNIQADANGCTVSPALPASLMLTNTTDNQTCQITGVPDAAISTNNLYTITGRNISGSSMATVTIIVSQSSSVADLPILSSPSGFEANISENNIYSAIGDFTDKMPSQDASAVGAKLTWSTDLGVATLNFTDVAGASVWVLAFTDDPTTKDYSDYAEGFITFDVMVPDYGSTPSLLFQTNRNSTCTNCTMDLGKVGDGFWQTIVVNIAGLTGFDPMTTTSPFGISPQIASQTAQNALSLMVQNIRWTNNEPSVPDAPALTSLGVQVYAAMDTVGIDILSGSGGAPAQCNADPTLPTGLSLITTATSCRITGNPTTVTDIQTYTITASNLGGKSSVDVMITINPQAPNLSDITEVQALGAGLTIPTSSPIVFTNAGGDVAEGGCSIASGTTPSALPTGLVLEVVDGTCHITGTPPAVAVGVATYTIEATNVTSPPSTATVMIEVIEAPDLEAITEVQTLTVDQLIPISAPIAFTNGGGAVGRCDIASGTTPEALPMGLVLEDDDDGTCRITGTPLDVTDSMEYTIAATNVGGIDADATVTIVVNPQAPNLTAITGTQTLIANQTTNLPIIFENTGGAVAEGRCSIASGTSALPAGLVLEDDDDGTCRITGTPLAAVDLATYSIRSHQRHRSCKHSHCHD